jgi:hypothetical protein
MEKRYQVFISSTFADLKEERGKVQQAVMELDCIPAGMELFPAIDEEQFEFIKKVIDDCDYYLLIIGGRYGSLSDEGVSYTEMEYKYAVSKGIKVIAFLHKDPNSLPVSKSETDATAREKLAAFRNEAATGRLVRFWTEANELPGLTLSSLTRTIRTYPAVGWIRGDSAVDPELYKELSELRKENQKLKDDAAKQAAGTAVISDIAGMSEIVTIKGFGSWYENESSQKWIARVSWEILFRIASPFISSPESEQILSGRIANALQPMSDKANSHFDSCYLSDESEHLLRIQFKALGLIRLSSINKVVYWGLTTKGESEMMNLLVVRKSKLEDAV